MSGLEATQKINEILARHRPIRKPFICLVTSSSAANFMARALQSGANYVVTKPIYHDNLSELLVAADLIQAAGTL